MSKIVTVFIGLLTIIFVVAKIFEKVAFSWLWVFSPIWVSLLVLLGILIIGVMAGYAEHEKTNDETE